jgi:hypothetical protein
VFSLPGLVRLRHVRAATPSATRNRHHDAGVGTAFVHTISGDHTWIA